LATPVGNSSHVKFGGRGEVQLVSYLICALLRRSTTDARSWGTPKPTILTLPKTEGTES